MCIAELFRVTQTHDESVDKFIERFKKMRNGCKVYLLKYEFVRMAQWALDFELRKKFQRMELKDFYSWPKRPSAEHRELLKEESYKKGVSVWTYYQKVEESVLAEVLDIRSYTCHMLKHKVDDSIKKGDFSHARYSFM